MDPEKTEPIRTWPVPQNIKELQQFLGLANYYNSFVPKFAEVAAPLTGLLSGERTWVWSDACQRAFEHLRSLLCDSPVLLLPDWSREFVIEADASDNAVGAVLL